MSPGDITRSHGELAKAIDLYRQESKAPEGDVAGFLGAPTLHRLIVSIDYRDNLVNFSYDPKRLTHCVDGGNIDNCY